MEKMRIYISGAITGNDNYKEQFKQAAEDIFKTFPHAEILNPVDFCSDIPESAEWRTFMDRCLVVLKTATHLYMLDGWRESKGAYIEYRIGKAEGLVML